MSWAHSPGPLCCHTLVPVVMVGHVCPGRVVTYYHVPLHQCHHTSASYTVACSLASPRANTVGDWKKNLWRHCSQGVGAGGGWEHMSTLGRQQVTESGDGNGERNKLQWAKIPRLMFVQANIWFSSSNSPHCDGPISNPRESVYSWIELTDGAFLSLLISRAHTKVCSGINTCHSPPPV